MTSRLERFYPGDADWDAAVRWFEELDPSNPRSFKSCADAAELQRALGGKKDLAVLAHAVLGSEALEWIRTPKEMLDGERPVDCAVGGVNLERRLRTMLMRM